MADRIPTNVLLGCYLDALAEGNFIAAQAYHEAISAAVKRGEPVPYPA